MTERKKREPASKPRQAPATTLEGRERQMVALATDLAERQIRDGKASSQIISHYIRLGTVREELEREKLKSDNRLAQAKIEAIASGKRIEELYSEAMSAFKSYSGQEEPRDHDVDY